MSSAPEIEISLNNFDIIWNKLDEEARIETVKKAAQLDPALAILPVIQGLLSYHFKMRSESRRILGLIIEKINLLLNETDDPDKYLRGLKESGRVSARIYQQIRPEMQFNEQSSLFQSLLQLGERGAYFALKTVLRGTITLETMKKVLFAAEDVHRLYFIDQYLKTSPDIRLDYGPVCKTILQKISHRDPVVKFYAGLFDRNQDADPFLNHIDFNLRNPDLVLEKEIASASPTLKVMGLKALAMMQDKVPWEILAQTLEGQEVKKLRSVVYRIVENSAVGVYPEMFDPILEQLGRCKGPEAVHAFKALVVTGSMPPFGLVNLVRKRFPQLLPGIYREIASLSRISFFFVQDIALNKDRYLENNFQINLACVLGMIQKRPERVVRIMKEVTDKRGKKPAPDFRKFVEKTKVLLAKEREDIEKPDKLIVQQTKLKKESQPKGLFHALLKSSEEKKIDVLKSNLNQDTIEFQDQVIEGQALTNRTFFRSRIFFNRAVIRNCDLSGSYFGNTCFKDCVLLNVNINDAEFESIDFDRAVLINVTALKTVFRNCSFQGARMLNCNFARAELEDAVFIDARISKTGFDNTRLGFASFAHAVISGVSFVSADLDQADFTGARARFSRFPAHSKALFGTQSLDYNARRYQLEMEDLPQIDKALVHEINQLIFCEFIHHGEMMFFKQNRISLLTAFDIFRPSQAEFFQIVPLLIHENIEFIGSGSIDPGTPCGIADYLPSVRTGQLLGKYTGMNRFELRRSQTPWIEGLFTMGSVGSLAQTSESDIDYWVCINENLMSGDEIQLLDKKLKSLEHLARERFRIHVTFFLVDVLRARNNDFGGFSQESSGSAQARLLKEEFYRTMIHVAGRLPLWSVLPTAISLNYYNLIYGQVTHFSSMCRYIDLGDIHAIPVNEYFGASIWQMFKWLKSPFKSIIKMALLEKYIASYGKEALLCNQYKNEWMNSGTHLKLTQNDSYIILLNHLLAFYSLLDDPKSMNLVLTCFFLKLEISKKKQIDTAPLGLRKILLEKCLGDWGWDENKVFEIGRFREWKYSWVHRLSTTLEKYMVAKYKKVKEEFKSRSQGLKISESDRKVLERKVQIEFQDKPFKIKKLLLVSRGHRHFPRLYIRKQEDPGSLGQWELLHSESKTRLKGEKPLFTADSIEVIGAWLITNRLYTNQSIIYLIPNPSPVTHDDIKKLYDSMHDFFSTGLNKITSFRDLERTSSVVVSLFVSLNFYERRRSPFITDYCAAYVNAWGEMFFRSHEIGRKFKNLDEAKKDILTRIGLKSFPTDTMFYFSRGQ
ncbi:class I adenylate cyclase [Desulfospira joergensenii]|uniref:class I adenylate cyclase n=1 Tax=Desulfospira joergensenii TaxID=53329 RepID=UPI0003B4CF33|nr:class I adenylate cyclase [Desulfospira joergensenii]